MIKLKTLILGGALSCALATAALAAGLYTNGLPVAGGSQYPTTIPLTGSETIPADTNLASGLNPATEAVTVAQLAGYSQAIANYSANSATASTTATAAQIAGTNGGFVVLDMTGSLGAAGALTTPTAAAIIAQRPNLPDGRSFVLRIINETAATNAWTLTAGSNVTVTGTATIVAAAYTDFTVTLNKSLATPTVVFQRIGSGTK
jgi:hypothetical protein